MTSRSATDATRFTANSPHAYSKQDPLNPSSKTSPPAGASPAVSNNNEPPKGPQSKARPETPQEKVTRLRAARLAQRSEQLSTWERTVIRGRVWADRFHRVTALSLIGFSFIAAGVTTFAVTDMIMYNRRKRQAFYNEQHSIYNTRMIAAIETEKAGIPLDEDQLLVLGREKNKLMEQERKDALGVWGRTKEAVVGGLSLSTRNDPRIPVPTEGQVLEKIGVSSVGVLEASEGKAALSPRGELEGVKPLVAEQSRVGRVGATSEQRARSQELASASKDEAATVSEQVPKQSRSWISWFGWGTSK